MSLCSHCQKRHAVTYTLWECYCEDCALETALALLAVCKLSDKAITALIASGWNMPATQTKKHFTATDIAKELGISAQKVGKVANQHQIKNDQYGEWRLDQAANSRKQIETFWYNQAGKETLTKIIKGNDQ
ncbi:hypothetical protein [Photobacterium sp. OFAV2-7]|uniref:hypothetical protein n=1 Tax=Photobacterium sp. OFAV2-7 TaxID=2917748 RepID=UPI001EF7043C|nr:hypothetical protein [Photobacterium sp. OFAV2-7]MCG7588280.1 hypothetical protein [Photobacterium sp. OFAV2-7]